MHCFTYIFYGFNSFILHTDSSLDGVGDVLYQKDLEGQLRVICSTTDSLVGIQQPAQYSQLSNT